MADVKQSPQGQAEPAKDAVYEPPAIVALGDVNTETLQTGIP